MSTNKRIRYAKQEDGILKSRRVYTLADGNQVAVILNPISMSIGLTNAVESGPQYPSKEGNTVNLAVLKIKAKEHLESLGVVFSDDVRVRKVKV